MATGRSPITGPAAFIGRESLGLISFGSGQPDLPPPKEIFSGLGSKRLLKYGLVQGDIELREALSQEYPRSAADDFVITNGASEALDLVLRALFAQHGRCKVLMGRPYYYSYPELVKLAGHEPVFTDLVDGKIDWTDFEARVRQDGVKAVLINSPGNPTGRVEELDTLRKVERLTENLGVYVISDEVYKDLIYGRRNYLIKGPHVVTVNSFSKTYSMCGMRVGYLYARDAGLVRDVVEIKTHTSMNTNVLGQEMALRATAVPADFVKRQTAVWKERRDLMYGGLRELGFDLWKPEGAFYVMPRIRDSARAVEDLYYDHGVIAYDGAWFGSPGRIRLSYALGLGDMREGLRRIGEYVSGRPERL